MKATIFDRQMFESLAENASDSDRRRANVNVHDSLDDGIQRLFITLLPDSYVKPHRHSQEGKFEFFLLVSGEVSFFMFDEQGVVIERYEFSACGDVCGIEIPPNTWHTIVANGGPATFLEIKPGPYMRPETTDFASWAPNEGDASVASFMATLRNSKVGNTVS